MVIWGAPIAHDNDPVRAVRASLEIQSELAKFNAHRAAQGLREIQFGISINTGNLVAGYIGSTQAMSYSVIGDIVNVAHGICPAAEPGQIIISESTYEYVHNHFDAVKLEPIQVKGKDEAISVYEILGEKLSAIQT